MLFRNRRTPTTPDIAIVDLASTALGRSTELTLTLDGPSLDAIEGADVAITLIGEDGRVILAMRAPLSTRTNLTIEGPAATIFLVVMDDLQAHGPHAWRATIASGRTVLARSAGDVTREWADARLVA